MWLLRFWFLCDRDFSASLRYGRNGTVILKRNVLPCRPCGDILNFPYISLTNKHLMKNFLFLLLLIVSCKSYEGKDGIITVYGTVEIIDDRVAVDANDGLYYFQEPEKARKYLGKYVKVTGGLRRINYQADFPLTEYRLMNPKFTVLKSTTITGIAQDAKAGAIIVTDDGAHYYIDGTDHWDKQLLGKRLTVTGELVEVTHEPQKGPEYRQGIVGTQKIIKKARIIRNM